MRRGLRLDYFLNLHAVTGATLNNHLFLTSLIAPVARYCGVYMFPRITHFSLLPVVSLYSNCLVSNFASMCPAFVTCLSYLRWVFLLTFFYLFFLLARQAHSVADVSTLSLVYLSTLSSTQITSVYFYVTVVLGFFCGLGCIEPSRLGQTIRLKLNAIFKQPRHLGLSHLIYFFLYNIYVSCFKLFLRPRSGLVWAFSLAGPRLAQLVEVPPLPTTHLSFILAVSFQFWVGSAHGNNTSPTLFSSRTPRAYLMLVGRKSFSVDFCFDFFNLFVRVVNVCNRTGLGVTFSFNYAHAYLRKRALRPYLKHKHRRRGPRRRGFTQMAYALFCTTHFLFNRRFDELINSRSFLVSAVNSLRFSFNFNYALVSYRLFYCSYLLKLITRQWCFFSVGFFLPIMSNFSGIFFYFWYFIDFFIWKFCIFPVLGASSYFFRPVR